ncbi:MAG: lipopolysaccharide biosynthesis protein [Roseiflexaceae bacterium]
MRHFIKTTTLYSLTAILGPVVALLLTPLYVAAIGVAGYGTVDLVQTVVQLLIPIAVWGLPTTLIAQTDVHVSATTSSRVFSSAMTLTLLVSSILSGLCLLLAPIIAATTQRPELSELLRIYACSLPFAAVYGVVLSMSRLLEHVGRTIVLMVAYVALLALSRLALVVWFDIGVVGMVLAVAITNIVVALLGVAMSWRWWWIQPDWSEITRFVRLGAPLLPASISVWMLLFIDRWFLVQYVSPLAQGQYAVAALLASLIAFVAEPFKQAWQPVARRQMQPAFLAWSLTMYCAVALIASAVVMACAPELLAWIGGADARAATPLIAWLLIAPLLSGVVAVVSMPAIQAHRTSLLAWATLAGALANIGLNIWLIPLYGIYGAAWATAMAALVIPLVHVRLHQTWQPIAYDWMRLVGLGGLWCCYVLLLPSVASSVVYRVGLLMSLTVCVGVVISAWHWRQWAAVWVESTRDNRT